MAGIHSAGIVLWRRPSDEPEILLVHPGGPLWAAKDEHAWSIPKGEFNPGAEEPLAVALREFGEELGQEAPKVNYTELASFLAGRKRIHAWLGQADIDISTVESNQFEMEWPPRSGKIGWYPEVDRAMWIALDQAKHKLHKGQAPLVRLIANQLR